MSTQSPEQFEKDQSKPAPSKGLWQPNLHTLVSRKTPSENSAQRYLADLTLSDSKTDVQAGSGKPKGTRHSNALGADETLLISAYKDPDDERPKPAPLKKEGLLNKDVCAESWNSFKVLVQNNKQYQEAFEVFGKASDALQDMNAKRLTSALEKSPRRHLPTVVLHLGEMMERSGFVRDQPFKLEAETGLVVMKKDGRTVSIKYDLNDKKNPIIVEIKD
jgi:hypothetical protein